MHCCFLTEDLMWLAAPSSCCHDHPTTMGCSVELWTKRNSFFPILLYQVFYTTVRQQVIRPGGWVSKWLSPSLLYLSILTVHPQLLGTTASRCIEFPCCLYKCVILYLSSSIQRPGPGNSRPRPLTYNKMTSLSRSKQLGECRWRQVRKVCFCRFLWCLPRRRS